MSLITQTMAGLALGLAGGLVHFLSLAWNLKLFLAGRSWQALGLQGLRLAFTVALLAGLAGLLVARHVTLRVRGVTTP